MRYLICQTCSEKGHFTLTPEDKRMGFKERRRLISSVTNPPNLMRQETILRDDGHKEIKQTVLKVMECDSCGGKMPEGTPATAITHWRSEEPSIWEVEYGAR